MALGPRHLTGKSPPRGQKTEMKDTEQDGVGGAREGSASLRAGVDAQTRPETTGGAWEGHGRGMGGAREGGPEDKLLHTLPPQRLPPADTACVRGFKLM